MLPFQQHSIAPCQGVLWFKQQAEVIRKEDKHVLFIIGRSKNKNVIVVYGDHNPSGQLLGISTFWLELEPSYQRKARQKGIKHDRVELSRTEQAAFDIKVQELQAGIKFQINVNRLPHPIFVFKRAGKRPLAVCRIKGKSCIIQRVWVELQGLRIRYIELFGKPPRSTTIISERIYI